MHPQDTCNPSVIANLMLHSRACQRLAAGCRPGQFNHDART